MEDTMTTQLLRKARLFLASDRQLPADLAAQLAAVGINVGALEENFAK